MSLTRWGNVVTSCNCFSYNVPGMFEVKREGDRIDVDCIAHILIIAADSATLNNITTSTWRNAVLFLRNVYNDSYYSNGSQITESIMSSLGVTKGDILNRPQTICTLCNHLYKNTSLYLKTEWVDTNDYIRYMINKYSEYHLDPVYVEATKLKYTDGTYNFIRGAADSERARKAAYNSLLKSYGTFYKGTEKELAECFANTIDQSSS